MEHSRKLQQQSDLFIGSITVTIINISKIISLDETSCMPNKIINLNNKLYKDEQLNRDYQVTDISESNIRKQLPEIFNILLIDRTTSTADEINNIIWANDNYSQYNHTAYSPSAQIRPELITGNMAKIIMPRALKPREQQKNERNQKRKYLHQFGLCKNKMIFLRKNTLMMIWTLILSENS